MRYVSSRRRSRAAVLVPSRCQPAVPIASGPVTETTRRQQPSPARGSARRRRREESSPPDAVAARFFRPLLMARGLPAREWQHPPVPSRLGPHPACVVGTSRRRPDAVAAWLLLMVVASGWWPWLVCRASRVRTTPSGPGDTARRRRVDESSPTRRRGAKGQGEGVPLERQNPHPQNTRTLRPWGQI